MDQSTLKYLFKKYHFHPQRQSGQNFLINDEVLAKIIQAAELKSTDVVLEIGAGFGNLTSELAKHVKKVIAVELDKRLCQALRKLAGVYKNIEVINTDITKYPSYELLVTNYKLIANLPYNITSWVIRHFLDKCSLMVLMVQKEVAERVCAKPGEMSLLSLAVQLYGQPEIIAFVPKEDFFPQPEVDSAILKIRARPCTGRGPFIMWLAKFGFAARRKKLANNLAAGLKIEKESVRQALQKANLSLDCRPQDLSVENWQKLLDVLQNYVV